MPLLLTARSLILFFHMMHSKQVSLSCKSFFVLLALQLLLLISDKTFVASQSPQTGAETAITSVDGAYTSYDNIFCIGFTGDTCNSCAYNLNYYFYGNECSKYQGRASDYATTNPVDTILRVCDDQCDSCVEDNSSNQGLYTGCTYSSESYAFYAYDNPATNTSVYERCVTDCADFGEHYEEVNSQGMGICSSCGTGCEICDSDSLCIECNYFYYRYTGTSSADFTEEVFTESAQPQACATRAIRTTAAVLSLTGDLSISYYITSANKSCTLTTCAGTQGNPYDDINLVFVHLLDTFLLGQKQEAIVNIYLMKTESTSGDAVDHFWREQDTANHYKRVFERTAVDVSIHPLVCDSTSVTTLCYDSDEKASVILKSNAISFFVTKTFTFKNIIVDGSELIPDSTCYEEYKDSYTRCCTEGSSTYPSASSVLLSDGSSNDAQCSPPTSTASGLLSVPWEAASPTDDLWKRGPFSFFVMNFLRDYPKYIPTLVIEGCVFKNFWYHRYAYSFIYLDQRGAQLTIDDTEFINFYFPMGLVTNMQKLTQRLSFFTTNVISTKINNCTTYNSSLSDCHSLTIQDSTFQNSFFGDYVFTASDDNYYSNEGIVLSLHEFRGPITIQGNTFTELASIKYSLVSSDGSSNKISAICSEPRASFDGGYRLSLDRHMQVVIGNEDWTKTPRTSSVLSVRNVTYGLTVYNNTFTNNAAETGTGLFVHNFENTEDSPIIVQANTFQNNFATEFGTAVAIIKYERDYVQLECKGIYLTGNTFEDNLGCPYVKGTVIVSCMPEKPKVSILSTFYDNLEDSTLQAYMLGYFVSTNDVNSFESTQMQGGAGVGVSQTQTQSRYSDLVTDEIDTLTQEIFAKFVQDIANTKDDVNATTHPILGTTIDTNRVSAINNIFLNNYAYHSQLFLQGAYNTLVQNNTFQDNSVPVPELISSTLTDDIPLFTKALASASYWEAIETTPLMIRMSNFIDIKDSTFTNNTQLLLDTTSLAFGAAITIDKHLGISNVSISDTTFSGNSGWTSTGLFALVSSTVGQDQNLASTIEVAFDQGVQGTLIAYNYWEYMYGVNIYNSSTNTTAQQSITSNAYSDSQSATPYILIDGCTFYNNTFEISSSSPVVSSSTWIQDDRTTFMRLFSAAEGMSLTNGITATDDVNSYGTYVLNVNIIYDDCTFELNNINDQRTFINPYGFNSLTLTNSEFLSNIVTDEDNGYYSIRSYIYSYFEQGSSSSLADLIVENMTFINNTGKVIYLEDSSSLDQTASSTIYTITIKNITIEDHISAPDFLVHLSRKQYTTLSSVTVSNASATLGFMYLYTPRDDFTLGSVEVDLINSTRTGCLYAESISTDVDLSSFVCENAIITETTDTISVTSTDSTYEQRELTITLDDIPVSACFSFYSATSLTVDGITCTSATLIGLSTGDDTTTDDTTVENKGVCINTLDVTNIVLTNAVCELGSMNSMLSSSEIGIIAYFDSATIVNITSVTFDSNTGDYTLYFSSGTVYVIDSTFSNNTGTTDGSVLRTDASISLTISDTLFTNNTCEDCDGTVYLESGTATITDCNFTYNTADNSGAISASLTTLTVTDSIFLQNTVETLASVLSAELATIIISGCTFEENTCESGEAAVYFYEGTITIEDSIFYKNVAFKGPRNLQVLDADEFTVNNCTFTDDGDDSMPLVQGGFIFCRNTLGTVNGTTFNNARGGSGGAIYLDLKQKTTFTVTSSTFKGCRAESQGEAIYIQGVVGSVLDVEDTVFSCGTPYAQRTNFKDLYAVYCTQVTCKFTDVVFNPQYADVDTGNQLYLYLGQSHEITNTNFTADCETVGNCYRILSSALRLEEVISLTVTDSIFSGWGDRLVTGEITSITSLGGAVRAEFPSTKIKTTGGTYSFSNCEWSDNQALSGGAIYATGIMNITVDGASFDSNTATTNGGAIYWNSTSTLSSFIVEGTQSFTSNGASSGGAYYFAARPIEVDGTVTFTDNTAGYGANKASYAVYVQLVEDPDSSIYEDYVDEVKSELNIARLLKSSPNRFLTTTYTAGEYLDPPMVLMLYDEFGQHVATDNSSVVTVTAYTSDGDAMEVDDSTFTAVNGYAILYPLTVYSLPGSTVTFHYVLTSFSASSVGRSSTNFDALYTASTETITLRECISGERLADDKTCTACSEDTYILSAGSTDECSNCPTGGVCLGYDEFGPDVDYFKLSYSTDLVVACYNDEACLGASVTTAESETLYCAEQRTSDTTFCYTGWCAAGYQGNVCGECMDGYAYYSVDDKTCTKCSSNPTYYLISVLISIAGVIYIVIMIRSALKETREDEDEIEDKKEIKYTGKRKIVPVDFEEQPKKKIENLEPVKPQHFPDVDKMKKMSLKGIFTLGHVAALTKKPSPEDEEKEKEKDLEELSITAIYLKILTDYIQLISIIGTFNFEWPTEMTNLFSSQDKLAKSSSELFSFDCMLRQPLFKNAGLSSFFAKLLIMALSPIAFAIAIFIVWYVIYAIKYRSRFNEHKNQLHTNIITSLVVTLFVLHPTIVELSTEAFQCVQLGDDSGDLYLVGDLEVKCWESTHLKWAFMIGLPSLLFWGLGIPMAALTVLYYNREDLNLRVLKAKFGFLYEGYFPRAYYWEFVIFYRKMVLIVVSVFMSSYSTDIQGAVVIGISCANYIFLLRTNPYLTETLNEMEKISLISSAITIYAGLFYLTDDIATGVKIFFFVVILLTNAYFFIYFGFHFTKAKAKELLEIKIVKKLFGRCLEAIIRFEWKERENKDKKEVKKNAEEPIIEEIEKSTPFGEKESHNRLLIHSLSNDQVDQSLPYKDMYFKVPQSPTSNQDTPVNRNFEGYRIMLSPVNQSFNGNAGSFSENSQEQNNTLMIPSGRLKAKQARQSQHNVFLPGKNPRRSGLSSNVPKEDVFAYNEEDKTPDIVLRKRKESSDEKDSSVINLFLAGDQSPEKGHLKKDREEKSHFSKPKITIQSPTEDKLDDILDAKEISYVKNKNIEECKNELQEDEENVEKMLLNKDRKKSIDSNILGRYGEANEPAQEEKGQDLLMVENLEEINKQVMDRKRSRKSVREQKLFEKDDGYISPK